MRNNLIVFDQVLFVFGFWKNSSVLMAMYYPEVIIIWLGWSRLDGASVNTYSQEGLIRALSARTFFVYTFFCSLLS